MLATACEQFTSWSPLCCLNRSLIIGCKFRVIKVGSVKPSASWSRLRRRRSRPVPFIFLQLTANYTFHRSAPILCWLSSWRCNISSEDGLVLGDLSGNCWDNVGLAGVEKIAEFITSLAQRLDCKWALAQERAEQFPINTVRAVVN